MVVYKMYIVYVKSDILINWINGPILLGTNVVHLSGVHCIREYGSTLYVGLARAVSPTNTNFRLAFLLTRLQEALYEDLAV